VLAGTVKSSTSTAAAPGRTPRALVEQAELSVRAEPDGLKGAGTILRRQVDLDLAAVRGRRRRGTRGHSRARGSLNQVAVRCHHRNGFHRRAIRSGRTAPVQLVLRAGEVQLKAEGAVSRPFSRREFDLTHELTGREIKGLDPLMDIVLPLQGEFHARGKVSARAERFTYEEELRVGRSDLNAVVTVAPGPARP